MGTPAPAPMTPSSSMVRGTTPGYWPSGLIGRRGTSCLGLVGRGLMGLISGAAGLLMGLIGGAAGRTADCPRSWLMRFRPAKKREPALHVALLPMVLLISQRKPALPLLPVVLLMARGLRTIAGSSEMR